MDRYMLSRVEEAAQPPTPPATPAAQPTRAAAATDATPKLPASSSGKRDWDVFAENLADDLDVWSPARNSGVRNYDLVEAGNRFVEWARQQPEDKPLLTLLREWSALDEQVTEAQRRKLRTSIKELDATAVNPPSEVAPVSPKPAGAAPLSEKRTTTEMPTAAGLRTEPSTPVAGHKVQAAFDVVELGSLTTSFDAAYDQSLQPRDRSRQASQNQIANIVQKFEPQR
jgi:hypothetical protein